MNFSRSYLNTLAAMLMAWLLVFSVLARADVIGIPELRARVTDITGTLSGSEVAQLEQKLADFEKQKGSQIAVLIVPSTQPEDIAQYSIRVVEQWKLGRAKVDDGVLLLVAKNDHKLRIEVGRGLEGAIPDVYAKRIVSDVIAPHFKQGDFAGGINAGVDKMIGLINGEQLPAPEQKASNADTLLNLLPFLLIGGMVLGGILRAMFGRFLGGALNGGILGALVWILGAALAVSIGVGVIAFIFTLLGSIGGRSYGGGYIPSSGGGWGGGSSSDDSFSGGGGGFSGGGASGDW